ncbi:MAG: LysM peptidoglycan-binding domain-containing protein [Anaerolineaceae bacterium]
MPRLNRFRALLAALLLLTFAWLPAQKAAAEADPMPLAEVSAGDLIMAMNTLRMANGLPALIEDPIIDAVAQTTAQIMADQLLSWHIGDVKGRIAAAGYGGGGTVWATENFAIGYNAGIDEIMLMWADPDHMRPATQAYYCNVGAGVARASNGSTYYILQAAYVSGEECGTYTSPGGPVGGGGGYGVIVPVVIAEPDADGRIVHEVQSGQSFWAIAVAYQVTIKEILRWNNLPEGTTLQVGQLLVIPNPNAPGYQTPTPVGYFTANAPGPDGKITHTVGAYQNLTLISQVYGVSIERILALNGLTIDMPLQIGQVLLMDPGNVTPTPTPRPLTPLEMLTPAADGKYYHTVGEGQNFSWIARYYGIAVEDLLRWNNMTVNYTLWAGEKLLLNVTPPATPTFTPLPPTETPTLTQTPTAQATPTRTPLPSPTSTLSAVPGVWERISGTNPLWLIPVVALLAGAGGLLLAAGRRKGRESEQADKQPQEYSIEADETEGENKDG